MISFLYRKHTLLFLVRYDGHQISRSTCTLSALPIHVVFTDEISDIHRVQLAKKDARTAARSDLGQAILA